MRRTDEYVFEQFGHSTTDQILESKADSGNDNGSNGFDEDNDDDDCNVDNATARSLISRATADSGHEFIAY